MPVHGGLVRRATAPLARGLTWRSQGSIRDSHLRLGRTSTIHHINTSVDIDLGGQLKNRSNRIGETFPVCFASPSGLGFRGTKA